MCSSQAAPVLLYIARHCFLSAAVRRAEADALQQLMGCARHAIPQQKFLGIKEEFRMSPAPMDIEKCARAQMSRLACKSRVLQECLLRVRVAEDSDDAFLAHPFAEWR